jgi:hypothetical protein
MTPERRFDVYHRYVPDNQDQDKRLVGQDERGLARLGLVSFETVLAWLIEKPATAIVPIPQHRWIDISIDFIEALPS